MINTSLSYSAVPEDRVAAIAYALWLEEGQPHDRAEAHWFKALEIAGAPAEIPDVTPVRKAAAPAAKKAAPRKRT